jgi:lysocardiolipin and lysophospholipid acyltransferase
LGLPLYFYNKDWYYAWQAFAKQYFGILLITLTQWWSPAEMQITYDKSLEGQFVRTPNGGIQLRFPERIVQISNHQVSRVHVAM